MNEKELSTFWKRIKLRRKIMEKINLLESFYSYSFPRKNHVLNITIKYYY